MILNSISLGDGPPLVLLHGLFGAARNLGALARGLSSRARVVCMDLRNHGASPHGAGMDFATMAEDVAQTCTSLGLGPVRLAGHSLGGKAAMYLALSQPEAVERLAVLDIAPVAYQHGYARIVQAMLAITLTPGLTRHAADAALVDEVPEAPMRAFLLSNLALGEAPHWRIGLAEIAAAMPQLLDWVDPPACAPFRNPTLFLRGGESDYVGPQAERVINRLFPAARQHAIAGANHWLHADKPAEVLAELEAFFFP